MGRGPLLVLTACLVTAALAAGCAGGDGPQKVSRSLSIPDGGTAEANLRMEAGANISYSWETEPPVNMTFTLEGPRNGSVEEFRNITTTAGEGSFTAPGNGTYSLAWRNRGVPVRLVVTIEGDFTLESFPLE